MSFVFNSSNAEIFLKASTTLIEDWHKKVSTPNTSSFDEVERDLEKTLQPIGDVDIWFFGLRLIGVHCQESELGIFVDVGEKFHSNEKFSTLDQEHLEDIRAALAESPMWTVKNAKNQASARFLIARHNRLGLNCRITIENGLQVCESEILGHFFMIQPEARKLVQFVKTWLECQGLQGTNFNRYSLTLLVVFFLQQQNMMPKIWSVQHGVDKEIVAGFEVQFDYKANLESCKLSKLIDYRNMIQGFFEFYSKFNYDRVISVFYGVECPLKKFLLVNNQFHPGAINIPYPINSRRSCQYINEEEKEIFVKLCRDSSSFLKENKLLQ